MPIVREVHELPGHSEGSALVDCHGRKPVVEPGPFDVPYGEVGNVVSVFSAARRNHPHGQNGRFNVNFLWNLGAEDASNLSRTFGRDEAPADFLPRQPPPVGEESPKP